ncbi:acyl carrier protein, partial [Maribacter sp. 2307UL18-2]|uniref:acyl carrier protein n=1 Tax=Maribacter sp. 2307UL18-2 TaxID=3386274 RepID=UPI0039BD0EFB
FELGGNSIKILSLSKKIEERLNVDVAVADLFRYSTIQSFVKSITGGRLDEEILRKRTADEIYEMDGIIDSLKDEQL